MARARTPSIADLRMEMVARIAGALGLVVVVASFAYSFAQIKWVADQLGGNPPWLSLAFPFIIDLPAVVASALTVALHDRPFRQRIYAWSILVLFTALSWLSNAVHALFHSSLVHEIGGGWGQFVTVLIAGFPPIGLVLGMHVWAYALRHSERAASGEHASAPARSTTTAPRPAARVPAQHPARAPQVERAQPAAPAPRADDDGARTSKLARARALFDEMVTENPEVKPPANVIQREAGLEQGQDGGMHPGHFRKYVNGWYADFTAARQAAQERHEPEARLTVAGDYPRGLSEVPVTLERRAQGRTGT